MNHHVPRLTVDGNHIQPTTQGREVVRPAGGETAENFRQFLDAFDEEYNNLREHAIQFDIHFPDPVPETVSIQEGAVIARLSHEYDLVNALFQVKETVTNVHHDRLGVMLAINAAFSMPREQVLNQQGINFVHAVEFYVRHPALMQRLLHMGTAYEAVRVVFDGIEENFYQLMEGQHELRDEFADMRARFQKWEEEAMRYMNTPGPPQRMPTRRSTPLGNRGAMDHTRWMDDMMRKSEENHRELLEMLESRRQSGALKDEFLFNSAMISQVERYQATIGVLREMVIELWGGFLTGISAIMIRESGFREPQESKPEDYPPGAGEIGFGSTDIIFIE